MTLMLLCTMEQKQQFDISAMLEVIGANLYVFLSALADALSQNG